MNADERGYQEPRTKNQEPAVSSVVSGKRHKTRAVRIGSKTIGEGAPIAVQSMTKTRTEDVRVTVRQIRRLERAGCEIIRCAAPNLEAAQALSEIKKRISIPLVADIHFDHKLALASIKAGADKVRINPGNIGEAWKVEEVIKAAADKGIPIRVGINSGSLPKGILRKFGKPTPAAICATLDEALKPFRKLGFEQIVISAKTSGVSSTIEAYQAIAERCDYPLHLGLTESGLPFEGAIRSAAALAVLLNQGIGDTIRISLTGDPVLEVKAAYELLQSLGLRQHGPTLISCPTCGRCQIDLPAITRQVKKELDKLGGGVTICVAVMGCTVNGPGEAREADYGIACGRKSGVLFERGKVVKTCPEKNLVRELLKPIIGDK
jgi:(E)-4-hydroxy-3-methylbut-2-enyl-diphosphate synthase